MPPIDECAIRKLAALARLTLSDAEVRDTAARLPQLLAYVARIQKIDVGEASETVHVGTPAAPLREDRMRSGLPRERVLRHAPSAIEGYFEVPRVVDPSASDPDDPGEDQ